MAPWFFATYQLEIECLALPWWWQKYSVETSTKSFGFEVSSNHWNDTDCTAAYWVYIREKSSWHFAGVLRVLMQKPASWDNQQFQFNSFWEWILELPILYPASYVTLSARESSWRLTVRHAASQSKWVDWPPSEWSFWAFGCTPRASATRHEPPTLLHSDPGTKGTWAAKKCVKFTHAE